MNTPILAVGSFVGNVPVESVVAYQDEYPHCTDQHEDFDSYQADGVLGDSLIVVAA